MTVRTSAGTTLKVSASTPATFDATGYNALTMTVVGEVSDLGEFGREFTGHGRHGFVRDEQIMQATTAGEAACFFR